MFFTSQQITTAWFNYIQRPTTFMDVYHSEQKESCELQLPTFHKYREKCWSTVYFTCRIIVTLSLEMLRRPVQTAAARVLNLVLNLRDLISLVLATLCWLPVKSWDEKSFSLPTNPLMTTLLIAPFNTKRSFSSQTAGLFEVPRSRKCRMGDGAFSYLPWNHQDSVSGTA